jgi:KipI family sensor histidine kinase inhibitor
MRIEIASENSFIIYFNDQIAADTTAQISACAGILRQSMGPLLVDLVPSYASLLVIYHLHIGDHYQAKQLIKQALAQIQDAAISQGKLVHLPVYYSEESGPDLAHLAAAAKLSVADTIALHHSCHYQVYAIGFAPGFAYLGEVDERLAAPRKATPRLKVPKGAVAIADRQTAVYPSQSPGGWNLIGLCPTPMFNAEQEPPMPVNVGDQIKFEPISRAEFLQQGGNEQLLLESSL